MLFFISFIPCKSSQDWKPYSLSFDSLLLHDLYKIHVALPLMICPVCSHISLAVSGNCYTAASAPPVGLPGWPRPQPVKKGTRLLNGFTSEMQSVRTNSQIGTGRTWTCITTRYGENSALSSLTVKLPFQSAGLSRLPVPIKTLPSVFPDCLYYQPIRARFPVKGLHRPYVNWLALI